MRKEGGGLGFAIFLILLKGSLLWKQGQYYCLKSIYLAFILILLPDSALLNVLMDRLTHKTQESLPWPHNSWGRILQPLCCCS